MSRSGITQSSFPPSIKVLVPSDDTKTHDIVSRWSDSGVSLPAATVIPSGEEDIISVIKFAAEHGLRVIPASGGHGSFVPIDGRTLYLDLKEFRDVKINKEEGSVIIGGGAIAGDVLKTCVEEGYYTLFPNSSAVGMTGAFLGGGSSWANGLHGFAIDHVLSIRLITSTGTILTLTPSTTDPSERSLFNVLCGAGHGLGVITSLTLSAWPLSNLHLTDNKIWTRRLVFKPTDIDAAAELYTKFLPPPPALIPVLVFARAPPSAPAPGAPMVMLMLSYYGPSADGEAATKDALSSEVAKKAIINDTALVPFEKINAGAEPFNAHGGFKDYAGCFCKEIHAVSIVRAFEAWKAFTDGYEDARARSYVVVGAWDTGALVKAEGREEKFFSPRENGVFLQCVPWYTQAGTKMAAEKFGRSVVGCLRERDRECGRRDWSFANNMVQGMDVGEVYTEERIEQIRRVKGAWDGRGVFWSPVVDGW